MMETKVEVFNTGGRFIVVDTANECPPSAVFARMLSP